MGDAVPWEGTSFMSPGSTLPSLRPAEHRQPTDILRIAHRGAGGAERYSRPDLWLIASQGAHMVEFDLHVTGDDRLVARHNPVVEVGSRRKWLADYPLHELRKYLERDGTPTVEDIIHAAKSAGVGLYVDIKSLTYKAGERLVELLEELEMASQTILASVRSDLVLTCADVAPRISRAVLFSSSLEEPVQLARSVKADFVHPCWERYPRPDEMLAADWLERIYGDGLGVICWHEERKEVLERLCEIGVDGICTDTPDLLTQVAHRA